MRLCSGGGGQEGVGGWVGGGVDGEWGCEVVVGVDGGGVVNPQGCYCIVDVVVGVVVVVVMDTCDTAKM